MEKIKKIFTSNICLSALLLIGVGLVLSIIGGFQYTFGTNDDYAISLLLSGGEERNFFISFFASFFFAHIQQLFPAINCYGISQVVLGIVSLFVVNYVFFGKLGKPLGAFVSLITDVILYSNAVLMVQFTQTTTLIAAAGILLFVYSNFEETRKGYRRLQFIGGALLILIASFYRFMSFKVVAAFAFILLFCVLLREIVAEKDADKWYKKIFFVLKKRIRFLICFVLMFALCFGANTVSGMLKNADPSYVAHYEAESGRSMVTDYPMATYKKNVEFYRENNVFSVEDISMINRGQIDPNVLDTQSMQNIGKFSVEYLQKGKSNIAYAISVTMEHLRKAMWREYDKIIALKPLCPIPMSYRTFVLCFGAAVLLMIALLVVIWELLRHKFGWPPLIYGSVPLIIVKILLALSWWAFFIVYPYGMLSCFMLLVCGAALLALRNANWLHTIFCWIFSLACAALYGYQVCFRLNFRSTFIFTVSAFLFLCYLIDLKHMDGIKNAKLWVRCISAGVAVAVAVVIAFNVQTLTWRNNYVAKTGVYQTTVYDYITDHPDNIYAMVVPCARSVDPNYTNSLLPADMPKNTLFYGSWNIYSDYSEKQMADFGITNLFQDVIDRDDLFLVTRTNGDYAKIIGKYLNNHYAKDGKTIRLEKVEKINCMGTYWSNIKQNDPLIIFKVIEE